MNLDEFQRNAIVNQDEKVLLIAPPGSGKTTVLIEKIKFIINDLKINSSKLCIITFSKSASTNIKERMKKEFIVGPFFGTLHSLAYKVLVKGKNKKIILDYEGVLLIKEVLNEYSIPLDEGTNYLSLISKYRGMKDEDIKKDIEISFEFYKKIEKEYKKGKEKSNALDFDDLMEEFLKFLKTEEGRDFKKTYSHILVDEFQDLNKIQIEILKELSEDNFLFCVGDEDQCIYSFRGADTSSMIDFENLFTGGKKLYLKYNYRSAKTVIDYANSIIIDNKNRNNKLILNSRIDESILKEIYVQDEKEETSFVIDKIRSISKFQSIALLFRTNKEMDLVMERLIKENIDFSMIDKPYNYLNKKIYLDIINYMKGSIYFKENLLKIINKPNRFNNRDLEVISEELVKSKPFDLLEFNRLDKNIKSSLFNLYKMIKDIKMMKPKDAIYYIVYSLKYIDYIKNNCNKYNLDIIEYLNDIDALRERIKSFNTVEEFINYIDIYNNIMEENRVTPKRIVLGSLHSVKGMEFNNVFIFNTVEGNIPHDKSLDDIEGERRLFYVGVTRAKENLYLLIPNKLKNSKVEKSTFLK